jgi:chemotaxis protein CheD
MRTVKAVAMHVSDDPGDIIVAPSIGAGIAVVIYDPQVQAGGILHFLLPDSTVMDIENAEEFPSAFADTGLPLFIDKAESMGMQRSRLRIILVGGAQAVNPPSILNFGKRNVDAATKILNAQGLEIDKLEVGGHAVRTIQLKIKDGAVSLEVRGQGIRTL